jgi:uncharacterized membrane protein
MDSFGPILILVVLIILLVGPALAIAAFVEVRRLKALADSIPRLTGRIYGLEQRLAQIEANLARLFPLRAQDQDVPAQDSRPAEKHAPPPPPARPESTPSASGLQPSRASAPSVPPFTAPLKDWASQFSTVAPDSAPKITNEDSDNFETLIAGRWFNYVGILALLFAVAFFLKYAFDNNWVGPRGRIGIGLLAGSALFPFSQKLLGRGYTFFSEGMAGLGAAILYLSLWAGWHYYQIFSQSSAFALMIVVTVVVAIISVGRNSERIAVLAILGGALTPEIVSTGHNQEIVLFTYLAVLGAGVLALARVRDWKWLPPVQFLATLVYFWGWYADFYDDAQLVRTLLFATVFFLLFAALPFARSYREGELSMIEGGIVLVNALAFLVALREMLWPDYRWGLTLAVIALAAVHLAGERTLPEKSGEQSSLTRMLFAGLALLFVTLVIPIRLDGRWITMAWVIEGVILIWSGLRLRLWPLRAVGYFLFFVVLCRVAFIPIPAHQFLLNARFASFVVWVACFALAWLFARAPGAEVSDAESTLLAGVAIAANIGALAALSLEIWDAIGRMQSLAIDRGLAQELALSSLWLLYAIGLMIAGLVKKWPALRWQSLTLLGVVIGKVFFVDLSFLDRFYRIISFLLLGLVLMTVSFYYQRRLVAQRNEKKAL